MEICATGTSAVFVFNKNKGFVRYNELRAKWLAERDRQKAADKNLKLVRTMLSRALKFSSQLLIFLAPRVINFPTNYTKILSA